jgi:hypothetical protein
MVKLNLVDTERILQKLDDFIKDVQKNCNPDNQDILFIVQERLKTDFTLLFYPNKRCSKKCPKNTCIKCCRLSKIKK